MPQDILRRLTWKQIVTLYRRGWSAEEVRGSAREAGRLHLYSPQEDHGDAGAENPPPPGDDVPDVAAIERIYGDRIKRGA